MWNNGGLRGSIAGDEGMSKVGRDGAVGIGDGGISKRWREVASSWANRSHCDMAWRG